MHKVEQEFPCEYAEEEHFDKTHHVEGIIHKETPHEDEASIFDPPFEKVIQASISPAHEEENVVSYTHFQFFDVALFHDSESEEVIKEPLDALDASCYNKIDDMIENIDDFIHVGRRKWYVIYSFLNADPIYDIEGCF
jgi:hypothetical protein